jgi:hypothetical protein
VNDKINLNFNKPFKTNVMAFGVGQIKNPTPSNIERTLKIIVAVGGAIIAWLQTATFIPDNASEIISGILGLVLTLSTVLTPMFGVNVTTDTIPTGDVTAVEVDSKKDDTTKP